jgi:outer membrane lipoprotein-sorting protein
MKQLLTKDQRGVGHLGLIIAMVVVLALGGVGYFVYTKNKNDGSTNPALQNVECPYDDKDLCKFFTSYKALDSYTVTSTSEADGEKLEMVLRVDGEDKSHLKMEGATPYEVITIGQATYTKAADGTWWKQTNENETAADLKSDVSVDLEEPETVEGEPTEIYQKEGKEKCGNLTCFKYRTTDSAGSAATTYIWFDDKDYQLRRTQVISDGNTSDMLFSYDNVNITEPSPVKELGENQYLLPGQSEPTTLPGTGEVPTEEEIQQMLREYQ